MGLRSYNLVALLGTVAARSTLHTPKSVLSLAIAIYERPHEFLDSLTPAEKAEYTRILLGLERIDQLELF